MTARIDEHHAQVARAFGISKEDARQTLAMVAFHCIAVADTVCATPEAPHASAQENSADRAEIEADFERGMRTLIAGALLRLAAKLIARLTYRFKVRGMEHVPATGPALLVANHVSFIDPVLIMAACPRDVRFIMDSRIFRAPGLGLVFRMARAIPIAPHHEEPLVYHAAFEQAVRALQAGEVVCIFPEGGITRDGQLQPFKGGIMKILARAREQGLADVPVAPLGLSNLWGSFFSRIEKAGAMTRPFRRGVFNRVALRAGPPVSGDATSPRELQARVQALID